MSNEELGARVREARRRAGLTQTQLGEQMGLGKGQVSMLENGKREISARELLAISKACIVGVEELLVNQKPLKKPMARVGGGCVSFSQAAA